MKTMAVGEFKARFSEVLDEVRRGRSIAIGYGKQKRKVAVIVPYEEYATRAARRLGVMEGHATYTTRGDFNISDEELLSS